MRIFRVAIMFYVCKDYPGNIEVMPDEQGAMVSKLSFDPWGRRRNPLNWSYEKSPFPKISHRGFTAHEHLVLAPYKAGLVILKILIL